jgi:DNA-directed RNA polymerase specialized sigma24 family protein
MSNDPSVTTLIQRLKAGSDSVAAQAVWASYSERLIGLARKKLQGASNRVRDEDDIALSAFNSFFRGIKAGRFSDLIDRNDLWQILVMLAERKAIDQIRKSSAAKRGGGKVRGDSALGSAGDSQGPRGLEQIADSDPSPEVVTAFTDECRRMFALLDDAELSLVALQKMEGYTCEEIARSLDRAPRSIERKLRTIRKVWEKEFTV